MPILSPSWLFLTHKFILWGYFMKEVPIQIAPAEVKRLLREDQVNDWKFLRERKGVRIFTNDTLQIGVTKRGVLVLVDTPKPV